MAAIYIISDHGKICKHDETLVFHQSDDTKTILFPYKTEHLVLMGNVSLSGDALRLIMKYKLGVTFLSSNGRFNGKLEFGDGKNVFLKVADEGIGVDFDGVYAVSGSGKAVKPRGYDRESGEVWFAYPKEKLDVYIPDSIGNTLHISMKIK